MEPTQGPYTVEHGSMGELFIFGDDGNESICQLSTLYPRSGANAALLAASWEMKEALIALLYAEGTISRFVAVEQARAALAKATQIT